MNANDILSFELTCVQTDFKPATGEWSERMSNAFQQIGG